MIQAWFHSYARTGGWNALLTSPGEVRTAAALDAVLPLVRFAEQSAQRGKWVALLLSYEAAPAFDPALKTRPPALFPLAWAAVFDGVRTSIPPPAPLPREPRPWQPLLSRAEYEAAIRRIKEYIARGDTYQVNYTFPLRAGFSGDAPAWFRERGPAQAAPFSAFLDLGRFQVLSFSPELFFEWNSDRIVCRPMKGTAPRGRGSEEDEAQARALADSRKNRAENLMITDMVRNDLGRIARVGSVKTTGLFEVERYPTLFQMTSTVEARPRPGTKLEDVLRAVFPGASVTGAPKVRTMEIIRALEPHPRGLYTGAIGWIRPGGDAQFNIPIRTVVVDRETGEAAFHIGGGVTWDSTAEGEYEECLLKAEFLTKPSPPFSLLETLRLENGRFDLLDRHLQRLLQSARYFDYPADGNALRARLAGFAAGHSSGTWRVRCLVESGGAIELDAEPLPLSAGPWRVALAGTPVDSLDRFLYHKTTRRAMYDRNLAAHPGCRDVLLWNERGEITESCLANVVVRLDGCDYTPPLACGLLPGTMRAELLAAGRIMERVIRREDLYRAEAVYLINSVRGRVRAVLA